MYSSQGKAYANGMFFLIRIQGHASLFWQTWWKLKEVITSGG